LIVIECINIYVFLNSIHEIGYNLPYSIFIKHCILIHQILLGKGRILYLANSLRLAILVCLVHTVIQSNLW